jgi:hypothetical protein
MGRFPKRGWNPFPTGFESQHGIYSRALIGYLELADFIPSTSPSPLPETVK